MPEQIFNVHDILKPAPLGWVRQAGSEIPTVYSWGLIIDPQQGLLGGMFCGWSTVLDEFFHQLPGSCFYVKTGESQAEFLGFPLEAYQIYKTPLPNGQGTTCCLIHKGALMTQEPVKIQDRLFFYTWGTEPGEPPYLSLWAERMQDVHITPIREAWLRELWNAMILREWASLCCSYNFAPLWEIAVSTNEWLELVMDTAESVSFSFHCGQNRLPRMMLIERGQPTAQTKKSESPKAR